MQHIDAVGTFAAIGLCVPAQRCVCAPGPDKLAERRSPASAFATDARCAEDNDRLVATTKSNRFIGRLISPHQAGFLIHTAPMLLVIVLAICLAVAEVLYFPVSPGAAAFAMGRSLTPASAATLASRPARVHESIRRQ